MSNDEQVLSAIKEALHDGRDFTFLGTISAQSMAFNHACKTLAISVLSAAGECKVFGKTLKRLLANIVIDD